MSFKITSITPQYSVMYRVFVNVRDVCVGALDAVASMSTQMSQLQDTPQESLQGEWTRHLHLPHV